DRQRTRRADRFRGRTGRDRRAAHPHAHFTRGDGMASIRERRDAPTGWDDTGDDRPTIPRPAPRRFARRDAAPCPAGSGGSIGADRGDPREDLAVRPADSATRDASSSLGVHRMMNLVLILTSTLFGVVGQLMLKRGMTVLGPLTLTATGAPGLVWR